MFTKNCSRYYFNRRKKMPTPASKPAFSGRPYVTKSLETMYSTPTRGVLNLDAIRCALAKMDVRRKPTGSGNNTQVFKGSALVSALLYTSPRRFKCRAAAFKFARRLFRLGFIRSIFGWTTFEDSSHLYRWEDENVPPRKSSYSAMMSYSYYPSLQKSSLDAPNLGDNIDSKLLDDVKGRLLNRGNPSSSGYLIDSFFRDLEKNFPEECRKPVQKHQSNYWQNKRSSTTSTDSSADPYSLYKSRDRLYPKSIQSASMASSRDHSVIPEEAPDTYMIGRLGMQMPPFEYEISSNTPGTYNSHASSGAESGLGGDQSNRRFTDQNFSFSDNEKQLLEEMKRMKKEHQHILRSYEDRINKLMMKMHELRSIAEMLENSSTKSSPYGIIPGKGLLGSLDAKLDQDRPWTGSSQDPDVPPPLPPRPSRGNKVYPNKPILQPRRKMKYIGWKRIILSDLGTPGSQLSIWHTMIEPKIDTDRVELMFNDEGDVYRNQVSLYDDVVARRGRSRNQVSVVDRDRAQLFVSKIHFLKLTLQDVIHAITDIHTPFLDEEGSDALLDLVLSHKDMDRVLHQAQRKGIGQFDIPDYVMFEISRVDHYREKTELLRFQQRIHDYLFDIDQQLKDVRTACEEICSSVYLKNLLETLLAMGNLMNGATAAGQADGYHLEVLTSLKDTLDTGGRENLLEFLIKMYCQLYTQDVSKYSLPEPSNMRHAAQVSLNDVNSALSGLSDDLSHVRKNISPLLHDNSGSLNETVSERLRQFFAKAEDSIETQKKHFRETKDNFQRTAAYFMFDCESEESTKTFFGTWAMFFHDCKHYWKDVQRKLAKERFQTNFSITPEKKVPSRKLPLPDPPPEIPPKPASLATSASSQPHQSPSKSSGERSHHEPQVKGRNLWGDATDGSVSDTTAARQRDSIRATADYQARQDQVNKSPSTSRRTQHKDGSSNRSSSPKRIISTPPTAGDIHRPVPTPPKPSKPFSNVLQVRQPNYENHDDAAMHQTSSTGTPKEPLRHNHGDNAQSSPRRAQIPVPDLEESQRKQSNGFSLKSWLRKESGKSRAVGQDQMVSPKEPEHQNKSNTAFVKLRNTVVQKFGNPGQTRRRNDSSSPDSKPRSASKDPRDQRHHSPSKYGPGYRDSSSGRSRSRSPSGERNVGRYRGHFDSDMEAEEEVAFYNGRSGKSRDISPHKYTETKAAPPNTTKTSQPDSNPNVQSYGVIDSSTGNYRPAEQAKHQNDMNNNEQCSPRMIHTKRFRGRDRAPLALGSNISLSDPYPRSDQSTKQSPQRQSWDVNPQTTVPPARQRHYNTIAGSSPVNPIPTYRAKVIHMYENQSKYDASEGLPQGVYHEAPQELHFHKSSQKFNTLGQDRSNNYLLMQSKDDQRGKPIGTTSDDRYSGNRRPQRPPQDKGTQQTGKNYQGGNPTHQMHLNQHDKTAAHAQSITSLIERFEAGKGPPPPGYSGSTAAMTSTPVTQRRHLPLSVAVDSHGRDMPHSATNSYRHTQNELVQNPFPLLDSVTQAATTGTNHHPSESPKSSNIQGDTTRGGGRHHGDPSPRSSHHQYPHHPSGQQSHGFDQQQRRPEHDEGYRDQLRRVLNNNTVLQRISKTGPGYGGVSSTSQRSPPQMMRAMPPKPSVYNHGGVTV